MAIKQIKCPKCGGQIEVDTEKQYAICQNCGKRLVKKKKPDTTATTVSQQIPQPSAQPVNPLPPQPTASSEKKGKKGCLIGAIIAIVLVVVFAVILIAILSTDSDSKDNMNSSYTSENVNQSETDKVYSGGELVTAHTNRGDYSFRVTKIRETKERNQFADEKPKRVIIIEYEYENISFDTDVVISYLYLRAYDKDGNSLTVYPDTSTKAALNISQGKKATASVAYGLDSDENNITLDLYDISYENFTKPEFVFNLTWK